MEKCPYCGKFLKNVEYFMAHEERVCTVEGVCAACGLVNPTNWEWETVRNQKNCPCDTDYCNVQGIQQ